jgi:hypothetical protein
MKFRRKPLTVNAFKFLGEKKEYPVFIEIVGAKLPEDKRIAKFYNQIHKSTLKASYGDWILYSDDKQDIWPCKSDIFEMTYEKLKEQKEEVLTSYENNCLQKSLPASYRGIIKHKFANIINEMSIENYFDLPDYIIAEYLLSSLLNLKTLIVHNNIRKTIKE